MGRGMMAGKKQRVRSGGNDMQKQLKQLQAMQAEMEQTQAELAEKEITTTAGGGAVEITVSGKKEITKVKLAEEVVDPDDIEMLEDLIMAAANEAFRKMEDDVQSTMGKLTGGLGLGGGFPF